MAIGKTNYPPGGVDTSDATAVVGDILSTKTAYGSAGTKLTGTMTNVGAQSITPVAAGNTITAGYHNGSGGVVADADFTAANIKTGVVIWGVTGTLAGAPTSVEADTSFSDTGATAINYRKFGKLYIFTGFNNDPTTRLLSDANSRNRIATKLGISISSYQIAFSTVSSNYKYWTGSTWDNTGTAPQDWLQSILAS